MTGADKELCSGVLVKKDDFFFRSVLVSVGRMGFVYSLVVRTVPAFKLTETRDNDVWEKLKNRLTSDGFPKFVGNSHFLQILVNPFGNGAHECKVARRNKGECHTANQVVPGPAFDFHSFIFSTLHSMSFIPPLTPPPLPTL